MHFSVFSANRLTSLGFLRILKTLFFRRSSNKIAIGVNEKLLMHVQTCRILDWLVLYLKSYTYNTMIQCCPSTTKEGICNILKWPSYCDLIVIIFKLIVPQELDAAHLFLCTKTQKRKIKPVWTSSIKSTQYNWRYA